MWLFQWDLIAKYYRLFHLNNQRTEWTWKSGKMTLKNVTVLAQEFPRRGTAVFLYKNVDIGPQCRCISYCHWSSHPFMAYSTSVQGRWLLEPFPAHTGRDAVSRSKQSIASCTQLFTHSQSSSRLSSHWASGTSSIISTVYYICL